MCPARMVKEYRKEAADNAVAVASSMRPVPVLRRTLDYLIAEVPGVARAGRWPSLTCNWGFSVRGESRS